jgi:hypothetical protein
VPPPFPSQATRLAANLSLSERSAPSLVANIEGFSNFEPTFVTTQTVIFSAAVFLLDRQVVGVGRNLAAEKMTTAFVVVLRARALALGLAHATDCASAIVDTSRAGVRRECPGLEATGGLGGPRGLGASSPVIAPKFS